MVGADAALGGQLVGGRLDRPGEIAARARHVHGGRLPGQREHLAQGVAGCVRLKAGAPRWVEPVHRGEHPHHAGLLEILARHAVAPEPRRQPADERSHVPHQLGLGADVAGGRQHGQPPGRISRHASRAARRRRRPRPSRRAGCNTSWHSRNPPGSSGRTATVSRPASGVSSITSGRPARRTASASAIASSSRRPTSSPARAPRASSTGSATAAAGAEPSTRRLTVPSITATNSSPHLLAQLD